MGGGLVEPVEHGRGPARGGLSVEGIQQPRRRLGVCGRRVRLMTRENDSLGDVPRTAQPLIRLDIDGNRLGRHGLCIHAWLRRRQYSQPRLLRRRGQRKGPCEQWWPRVKVPVKVPAEFQLHPLPPVAKRRPPVCLAGSDELFGEATATTSGPEPPARLGPWSPPPFSGPASSPPSSCSPSPGSSTCRCGTRASSTPFGARPSGS